MPIGGRMRSRAEKDRVVTKSHAAGAMQLDETKRMGDSMVWRRASLLCVGKDKSQKELGKRWEPSKGRDKRAKEPVKHTVL